MEILATFFKVWKHLSVGGFHSVMSFLGCIGHSMQGSGFAEILETVYASNAVVHMLNGKAVARTLRGHFLVENALYAFLASNVAYLIFSCQLKTKKQNFLMTPMRC